MQFVLLFKLRVLWVQKNFVKGLMFKPVQCYLRRNSVALSWNRRMHRMSAQTVAMPLWELWRAWDSCRLVAGWGVSGPQFHRCWQKLWFQRQIISSIENSMDFMFVEGDIYEPQVPWGCGGGGANSEKPAATRHPALRDLKWTSAKPL